MPDVSPVVVAIGLVVLIGFLLMFALGTQGNIRRGNQALRWLQSGLPALGRRTRLRWLGSTAVELTLTEVEPPFSEAQVLVVLEPRDVGFLWALGRARGRRDFVVLRGRLTGAPRFEAEIGRAGTFTGMDKLDRLDESAWSWTEWDEIGVRAASTPDADLAPLRRAWADLRAAAGGVWRLSVRRDNPHVEAHVTLPDLERADAAALIGAFRRLAESLIRR